MVTQALADETVRMSGLAFVSDFPLNKGYCLVASVTQAGGGAGELSNWYISAVQALVHKGL